MRWVTVSNERYVDVMTRCGAYVGEIETGRTHTKELACRSLSHWAGETVVGVRNNIKGQGVTCSIAGYLDDYYK